MADLGIGGSLTSQQGEGAAYILPDINSTLRDIYLIDEEEKRRDALEKKKDRQLRQVKIDQSLASINPEGVLDVDKQSVYDGLQELMALSAVAVHKDPLSPESQELNKKTFDLRRMISESKSRNILGLSAVQDAKKSGDVEAAEGILSNMQRGHISLTPEERIGEDKFMWVPEDVEGMETLALRFGALAKPNLDINLSKRYGVARYPVDEEGFVENVLKATEEDQKFNLKAEHLGITREELARRLVPFQPDVVEKYPVSFAYKTVTPEEPLPQILYANTVNGIWAGDKRAIERFKSTSTHDKWGTLVDITSYPDKVVFRFERKGQKDGKGIRLVKTVTKKTKAGVAEIVNYMAYGGKITNELHEGYMQQERENPDAPSYATAPAWRASRVRTTIGDMANILDNYFFAGGPAGRNQKVKNTGEQTIEKLENTIEGLKMDRNNGRNNVFETGGKKYKVTLQDLQQIADGDMKSKASRAIYEYLYGQTELTAE